MQSESNLRHCATLDELFAARVQATPDQPAYRHFDNASQSWEDTTWRAMASEVGRWQAAMSKMGLQAGDKVAVMMRNCREWVVFDQAALGLGLISVPLFADDRADNAHHILAEAEVKLLVVEGKAQWERLQGHLNHLDNLKRIVSVQALSPEDKPTDSRIDSLSDWLFGVEGQYRSHIGNPDDLATIVYTSGTTGRPKGVMLSHRNILSNALAASSCYSFNGEDVFLSFLPLSHMLERTAGYYLPMLVGATVAYARSIPQLGEDLQSVAPTILISVPRIYERVYGRIQDQLDAKSPIARALFMQAVSTGWKRFLYQQGRGSWTPDQLLWPLLNKAVASKVLAKLGGRLRLAVCGGAPLSPEVAKLFIGLGLPVVQGYGLTESSPVIAVNLPEDNIPASIGPALPGVEVKIGENDELLAKGDLIMKGYWKNPQATADAIDSDGWLHTGDKARMDETGHLYITGRIKEIIVLANGEKVPPADMELAIAMDSFIDQVMVIGEGKPYLAALVVLNPDNRGALLAESDCDPECKDPLNDTCFQRHVLKRVCAKLNDFPGYAQIRRVAIYDEPWTVDNGLLTPTMKMKRQRIMERFADDIARLYEGHE